MSHDVISDALNNIMNAKRAGKNLVVVRRYSRVLVKVLEIAEKENYIEEFKEDDGKVLIKFGKELHVCRGIKPRHNVNKKKIDFYMRRYLPARGMGTIIISTNQGLMTHYEAVEKNLGGSLIAYFY